MEIGRFKDFTGEKVNGWDVVKCERYGGNKPTLWLARHKCGNEQVLRIDQLRSGRDSLCLKCGKFNNRTAAAKVASAVAARKPREKKGPTLLETITRTRRASDVINQRPVSPEPIERRDDTWDVIWRVQRLLDGNQRQDTRC